MNKSVMKCCICNNENIGQFITINNKKYHLCCIEQLKEEKQEWINLLAMFKNQQKEFIKWLEDYLKLFDKMCIDEQGYYDMLEEILNKYKEIIGVSDEKK